MEAANFFTILCSKRHDYGAAAKTPQFFGGLQQRRLRERSPFLVCRRSTHETCGFASRLLDTCFTAQRAQGILSNCVHAEAFCRRPDRSATAASQRVAVVACWISYPDHPLLRFRFSLYGAELIQNPIENLLTPFAPQHSPFRELCHP